AQLELVATDKSGSSGRALIDITIDNTPPVALLDAPTGTVARSELLLSGTATDTNFSGYVVEFAAGGPPTCRTFYGVVSGTQPGVAGPLAPPPQCPRNGRYPFSRAATDKAGNTSSVDNPVPLQDFPPQPPLPPAGLVATIVPPNNIHLIWAG